MEKHSLITRDQRCHRSGVFLPVTVNSGRIGLDLERQIPVIPRLVTFKPPLNDDEQMRLPQELVEDVIDRFSNDHRMLVTCSLVGKTWLARSRHHLFNRVALNKDGATKWSSSIRPGLDGVSYLVRTLTLQQTQGCRWLGTESLDAMTDHFSSFQHVENLSVTWLDLSDFEPGSLAFHFAHYGSSLRSLRLSYLSADYSTLISFLELFPNLEDLLIHTPDLCDDDPPLRISRTSPVLRRSLKLLSFDLASSPFISRIASLDLRFSSISVFDCEFLYGCPLTNLLEASCSSLRHLELEYVTFCRVLFVFILHLTLINVP